MRAKVQPLPKRLAVQSESVPAAFSVAGHYMIGVVARLLYLEAEGPLGKLAEATKKKKSEAEDTFIGTIPYGAKDIRTVRNGDVRHV